MKLSIKYSEEAFDFRKVSAGKVAIKRKNRVARGSKLFLYTGQKGERFLQYTTKYSLNFHEWFSVLDRQMLIQKNRKLLGFNPELNIWWKFENVVFSLLMTSILKTIAKNLSSTVLGNEGRRVLSRANMDQ